MGHYAMGGLNSGSLMGNMQWVGSSSGSLMGNYAMSWFGLDDEQSGKVFYQPKPDLYINRAVQRKTQPDNKKGQPKPWLPVQARGCLP